MAIVGSVREWHVDDGWGVLDTAGTPGGCWAHFSAAAVEGYAAFAAGDEVQVEFEIAAQDGYAYRATRFWPSGATPQTRTQSDGGAFTSTLTLDFD